MDALIAALISLVVGGISGFVTASVRSREQIDAELRAKRAEAYERLLALMARVPAWPPDEELTYRGLFQLQKGLRAWYFSGDGLLMSTGTRKAYSRLQENLDARRIASRDRPDAKLVENAPMDGWSVDPPVADGPRQAPRLEPSGAPYVSRVRGDPDQITDDYDVVQQLCSHVRTQMTEDLLSRARPIAFRWTLR